MTEIFSLFDSSQITLLPGQKRIPSQELSKIVSAQEVLELVKQQATVYKQQVAKECEATKEAAFQEGFQEGLKALNHHIVAIDKELKHLRDDIQKKIIPLALSAARKIMGEELKMHPDRIVDIVLTSLKPVTQHRKIIIYVNRQDLDILEQNRPRIKEIFENLDNLSIQERNDIEPGGCMIETEAGIINAQLENQWKALESAFQSFMSK